MSNAGAGRPGHFLDHDRSDLTRRLQLNAGAHLQLAHGFGRRLVDRGGGGLLLVSALGAPEGIPHMADAAGAKAAVASLGESLHHELSPYGVQVTVMLPGNVDTPIMEAFALGSGVAARGPPQGARSHRQGQAGTGSDSGST